ncbi:MAG TPA: prepilin-type N-terminal cleavage/methylation domain-containing protein [Verrucomicrobiae bacterium]|jgi:prepilin-type N-terminal cleavage/methylation domain-containing protein|nr:prepilin-type N-terminal cleavage/methylation domain-containing protein [Verrucomicrobiae bacterium]
MKSRHNRERRRRARRNQRGFTLTEVLIAIVILLVGIVAVAQLVPASISSNSTNRNDSSALVFAQRQMDQFLNQPLNNTAFIETIDSQTFTCNLGDPTQPNVMLGSNYALFYNQLVIDFSQTPPVTNYSFIYHDPNDPAEVNYDVRWAVYTTTNNGAVTSKRFILGARKKGGNGIYNPVTLDTILDK